MWENALWNLLSKSSIKMSGYSLYFGIYLLDFRILCTLGYLLAVFLKEAMKYEVTYILHYTLNLQVLEKCPDKEETANNPPK